MIAHRLKTIALTLASLLTACVALGLLVAMFLPTIKVADLDTAALPAGWRSVQWPLTKDQFQSGVALECLGTGCQDLMQVVVRAKIGFCNCVTGVADDEDLDRIGDVSALGADYSPVAGGEVVTAAGLSGRQRLYKSPAGEAVTSVVLSHRCDAVAVTARGTDAQGAEARVLALIESKGMRDWIWSRLGP